MYSKDYYEYENKLKTLLKSLLYEVNILTEANTNRTAWILYKKAKVYLCYERFLDLIIGSEV